MVDVFFFKQKTAYEMRISDGSSDVCSSDLAKGEGTQDLVDPERQDEQQDHGARKAALGDLRDVVGDGVAEREVEQGNEDRDDDGAQEDLEMEEVERDRKSVV